MWGVGAAFEGEQSVQVGFPAAHQQKHPASSAVGTWPGQLAQVSFERLTINNRQPAQSCGPEKTAWAGN